MIHAKGFIAGFVGALLGVGVAVVVILLIATSGGRRSGSNDRLPQATHHGAKDRSVHRGAGKTNPARHVAARSRRAPGGGRDAGSYTSGGQGSSAGESDSYGDNSDLAAAGSGSSSTSSSQVDVQSTPPNSPAPPGDVNSTPPNSTPPSPDVGPTG